MTHTTEQSNSSELTGVAVLHDPSLNKGTGYTEEERDRLKIRGLLPHRVTPLKNQTVRALENFRRKPSNLDKYIFCMGLQERNERLFYRTVIDHIEEFMPIIYTPTVGQACREYAHIFRRPQGLYVTTKDRGRVAEILGHWPDKDIRIIVVTDGERILGLGDLGANGMGIPVGKLSLYTACAGVQPDWCLPVMLDVGTNNSELREDPLYLGLPQERVRGEAYDELVEEFMTAVQQVFPRAVIQFEDFGNRNAFPLLHRYKDRFTTFNDDIQGTAAVALAGLLATNRVTGRTTKDHKLLFLGAGAAATGIADLVVSAMVKEGLSEKQARSHCWFVDSTGLVVKSREGLQDHKLPFAHDHAFVKDLATAVDVLQPTALIGACGQPQTFTKPILEAMTRAHEHPIVFALSNPTSKAECTAEQAYHWTQGRCVYASGSPFDPVTYEGKTFVPGQGNNAYIFPGLGLGVIASGARRVTEEMFAIAAKTLADSVTESMLARGQIYPPLRDIREVSAAIATAVAEEAYDADLATVDRPKDLASHIRSLMFDPTY